MIAATLSTHHCRSILSSSCCSMTVSFRARRSHNLFASWNLTTTFLKARTRYVLPLHIYSSIYSNLSQHKSTLHPCTPVKMYIICIISRPSICQTGNTQPTMSVLLTTPDCSFPTAAPTFPHSLPATLHVGYLLSLGMLSRAHTWTVSKPTITAFWIPKHNGW